MSYKDGIPLLTSFGDYTDDDDIETVYRTRRCSPKRCCNRRSLLFIIVLGIVVVIIMALVISIVLGVTLKKPSSSSQHPSPDGHGTGGKSISVSGTLSPSPVTVPGDTSTSLFGTHILTDVPTPTTGMQSQSIDNGGPMGVSTTHTQGMHVITSSSMAKTSSSMPSMTSSSMSKTSSSMPSMTSSSMSKTSSSMPSMTSSSMSKTSSSMPSMTSSSMPSSSNMSKTSSSMPKTLSTSSLTNVSPTPMSPVKVASSAIAPSPTTKVIIHPTFTAGTSSFSFATPTPTPTPFPSDSCSNDTLSPSPMDNRKYCFKVLSNGLRVVLISDPHTDLSGASMNVAAGSFDDPSNYTGLAHFCEHMLFLGTKKYPEENEYSNFLSTHGGYDNAYTSTQETNYHFRVAAGYLEHSLDMFAHFFIDPLLSQNSSSREINAVNQEHKKNLLSDNWKLWQLLKHVSNPDHPFSQFNTGDLDTLNKSDINDQLQTYYHTHYSASKMNLAVYGQENIPVLLQWVEKSFTNIINTNVTATTYKTTPFPADYTGKIVYYYPQANTNILTIYWQTESLQPHHKNFVSGFLTRYLSHEGEGSLFQYLQMLGLASSLTAGTEVDADSFHLFSLQVMLTEEGLDCVSEVISSVFQFTRLLTNMTEMEFDEKWNDFINVSRINFDYAEKKSPNDYAVDITTVMRVVDSPEDFLPNPRGSVSNYSLTISTAQHFVPDNSVIFIGTHNINISESVKADDTALFDVPRPLLNLTEPIYKTPYNIAPIPHELSTYWSTDDGASDEIYLPHQNNFVPNNLALLPSSGDSTPQCNSLDNCENCVLQDTDMVKQAKVNFYCELRTIHAETSASWEARTQLFVSLVNAALKPALYDANELGYTSQVTATPQGLILTFGGLSDQQIMRRLISLTMDKLVNIGDILYDMDYLFDVVKTSLLDDLMNFNYTVLPYKYTYQYIQSVIMERPFWKNEEIYREMEGLDLEAVLNTTLLSDVTVLCLTHGNTNSSIADSYFTTLTGFLTNYITTAAATRSPGFFRSRVQLNQTGDYGVDLQAFNPSDENSVVNVVFQAGPVCDIGKGHHCSNESLQRSLYLSLLRQVIADACFTQLRTIEKLGYVVFCFSTNNEGMGSFQVLVQSEEFAPKKVLESINNFLESFYNEIMNSSDKFDETIAVLNQTLHRKYLTLSEKTDSLWKELVSGQRQFDLRQQKVAALDGLDYEGFREFYNKTILQEEDYHKLIIVVYGAGKNFSLGVDHYIDYYSLDQTKNTIPLLQKSHMAT